MSNSVVVRMMTNLINRRFYATGEEAVAKLDVYYAMNRISDEEYADLVMLADDVYAPPAEIPEEPTETPTEPTDPPVE